MKPKIILAKRFFEFHIAEVIIRVALCVEDDIEYDILSLKWQTCRYNNFWVIILERQIHENKGNSVTFAAICKKTLMLIETKPNWKKLFIACNI